MTALEQQEALATSALGVAHPLIESFLAQTTTKGSDLFIAEALGYPDGTYQLLSWKSYGDPEKWDFPFDGIATAKIRISARTGLPSREAQLMRPELLNTATDTIYWGSDLTKINVGGQILNLIAGASGVQPWFDLLFARTVLNAHIALTQNIIEAVRAHAISDDRSFFLGD
jgi:hypothetical protein